MGAGFHGLVQERHNLSVPLRQDVVLGHPRPPETSEKGKG
jgi:hypothetical protein